VIGIFISFQMKFLKQNMLYKNEAEIIF